ncbi:unnamed protein product [Vitrella brassicaformis CCMP3155]|uniref:Uncharacterized protein n=1 Tax=Vitrella brassicaformis (strain CCMP3155) TaxID=1169540 RepID=A0A0G4F8P5_VITBC|nr:unnamed protein product [Vitrella brassicaformis CCMP3155]|eukprot:CEM09088.1 unnamed protein product [Vitrella brassicaformis CCMP3155]
MGTCISKGGKDKVQPLAIKPEAATPIPLTAAPSKSSLKKASKSNLTTTSPPGRSKSHGAASARKAHAAAMLERHRVSFHHDSLDEPNVESYFMPGQSSSYEQEHPLSPTTATSERDNRRCSTDSEGLVKARASIALSISRKDDPDRGSPEQPKRRDTLTNLAARPEHHFSPRQSIQIGSLESLRRRSFALLKSLSGAGLDRPSVGERTFSAFKYKAKGELPRVVFQPTTHLLDVVIEAAPFREGDDFDFYRMMFDDREWVGLLAKHGNPAKKKELVFEKVRHRLQCDEVMPDLFKCLPICDLRNNTVYAVAEVPAHLSLDILLGDTDPTASHRIPWLDMPEMQPKAPKARVRHKITENTADQSTYDKLREALAVRATTAAKQAAGIGGDGHHQGMRPPLSP